MAPRHRASDGGPTDTRAVAPVVGAVMLFAILIVALSVYQAYAVPIQNGDVEFTHNQEVRLDLQELRDALLNTGIGELKRSVTVQVGTQYDQRLIFVNPPDPEGTIRTSTPATGVTIENATVTNAGDLTNDPQNLIGTEHETRLLSYTPQYAEFDEAPDTHVEHSLVYDAFPNGNRLAVTDQRLIDGNTLEIVILDGDLEESGGGAVTIDPHLVSGPTETIEIESDGNPITLTFPSENPSIWEEALADETAVQSISTIGSTVTVELVDDTYSLTMAKVGVGSGYPAEESTFEIGEAVSGGGNGSVLPGPRVTASSLNESTVTEGDDINASATFNNSGTETTNRGGTPIVRAEWYLEENSSYSGVLFEDQTSQNRVISAFDTIDTTGLDPGDYTVQFRGLDSRGIWTNVSEDGFPQTFTVTSAPTFSTATAEIGGENPNGVDNVIFEYQIDNGTEVEFNIYDDGGNLVGSSGVIVSDGTLSTEDVSITSGSNSGGNREPRPITVEANIVNDGACSQTIQSGDGNGPFDLCA